MLILDWFSSNGTYVNDSRIPSKQPVEIKFGDMLAFLPPAVKRMFISLFHFHHWNEEWLCLLSFCVVLCLFPPCLLTLFPHLFCPARVVFQFVPPASKTASLHTAPTVPMSFPELPAVGEKRGRDSKSPPIQSNHSSVLRMGLIRLAIRSHANETQTPRTCTPGTLCSAASTANSSPHKSYADRVYTKHSCIKCPGRYRILSAPRSYHPLAAAAV